MNCLEARERERIGRRGQFTAPIADLSAPIGDDERSLVGPFPGR
jgi:hypothetical protein